MCIDAELLCSEIRSHSQSIITPITTLLAPLIMGLSKTPQVGLMTKALRVLLHEARRAKPTDGIGAALTATELARLIERNKGLSILAPKRQDDQDVSRQTHFARIETAVRSVFNTLLVSMYFVRTTYTSCGLSSTVFDVNRATGIC